MYGRIWELGHFSSRSVVFPRHGTGTGVSAAAEEAVAAEVHSLRVRCRFDRVALRPVSGGVFPLRAAVHRL